MRVISSELTLASGMGVSFCRALNEKYLIHGNRKNVAVFKF